MVSHVYDITYGVVSEEDNLVVIDDSIVRGTTLKESILKILTVLTLRRSSLHQRHRRFAILIVTVLICRNCRTLSHLKQ